MAVENIADIAFSRDMDHGKLVHFLAVIDEGHFGRAGARLGVSQQAISKSILKLETDLAVKLFERGLHGATPTEFGAALARRARIMLSEADLAVAEIDAIRGGRKGIIRIGVGLSFATKAFPEAIRRFRRARPGYGITGIVGSSGQLYRMLLNGEFDFVVSAPIASQIPSDDIQRVKLFEEFDVPVVSENHPLAKARHITLADLAKYPWIVPANLPESWQWISSVFTEAGLSPPKDIMRTDSITLGHSLVTQDDYVVLSLINNLHPGASNLVELETPWPKLARVAYIATRKRSRLTTGAKYLVDLLVKESKKLKN
jgi:DNA-binding transcriptional LysR family regulator